MTVRPGDLWRPTNPARAGRLLRVMRTDDTHAHVLYPGGRLPVPVGDEPAPEQHPDQLTIFDALEAMQK